MKKEVRESQNPTFQCFHLNSLHVPLLFFLIINEDLKSLYIK